MFSSWFFLSYWLGTDVESSQPVQIENFPVSPASELSPHSFSPINMAFGATSKIKCEFLMKLHSTNTIFYLVVFCTLAELLLTCSSACTWSAENLPCAEFLIFFLYISDSFRLALSPPKGFLIYFVLFLPFSLFPYNFYFLRRHGGNVPLSVLFSLFCERLDSLQETLCGWDGDLIAEAI